MARFTVEKAIDPRNPGDWILVEANEWRRIWEREIEDGLMERRTEYLHTDKLLQECAEHRALTAGLRWGTGQIIGAMPLNLRVKLGLDEAHRQGDKAYIAKIWNDIDYKHLRKKEGRI